MGKLKKNQPGYTQAKDANGRTYWKPNGSDAPNAGNTSGDNTVAASDFGSSSLSEEQVDDARNEVIDHINDVVIERGFDQWENNPRLNKPLGKVVEEIGYRYAADLRNNPDLVNIDPKDVPKLYEDITMDVDISTGDIFADKGNRKMIEMLSESGVSVDDSYTASIKAGDLLSPDKSDSSVVFSEVMNRDFNKNPAMNPGRYRMDINQAVDEAMDKEKIKKAVEDQGGNSFEWNQKIGYIPVQLEIFENEDKYINKETGEVHFNEAFNTLLSRNGAIS